MRLLQAAVFALGCFLVVGGYAASQYFVWTGRASQWHRAIDRPEVALLATVALIGAIIVYVIPERVASSEDSA